MKPLVSILIALIVSTTAYSMKPNTPLFLSEKELYCIIEAVYFESRGESTVCQIILIQSVFNRMVKPWYPSNACDVINQSAQYSYKTQIKDLTMYDSASKNRAIEYLHYAINMPIDLSMGATHFVKQGTWTYWQTHPKVTYLGQCDNHIYFKEER